MGKKCENNNENRKVTVYTCGREDYTATRKEGKNPPSFNNTDETLKRFGRISQVKKLIVSLLILSIFLMAAVPSMALAASSASRGRLVIYSSLPTAQLDLMLDMFGDKYPSITVDVFSATEADVMGRVQAEAGAPAGDVVLGGGLESFHAVQGLLSAYTSANADAFHAGYNTQAAITPIRLHVSAMIVNEAVARETGVQVDGWASLRDERLSGRVVYMDPAATSPDLQQADFVKAFASSLEEAVAGAPSFVLNAVTAGQYAVGILSEEKAIERKLKGADLRIVYAGEGVAMGASYAGILDGAQNAKAAKQFVDFITSRAYQQAASEQLHQRSIRRDVDFGVTGVVPTENLRAANYDQLTLTLIAQATQSGNNR